MSWVGIFVPAKTPRAIIDRLHQVLTGILQEAEVRERFAALGIDPVGNTPAAFAAQIAADLARWKEVVQRGNIKAE